MPQPSAEILRILAVALLWAVAAGSAIAPGGWAGEPQFERVALNPQAEYGSSCVFDVDGDGRRDIFSGGYWYRNPDWTRHAVREVQNIRGRFDDYSNLPLDVNRDGWIDVISVNYRSQSLYWVEHPGPEGLRDKRPWTKHLIDTPGASETGRLFDIDRDGQLDVLPNGVRFAAWYRLGDAEPGRPPAWIKEPLDHKVMAHGIGAGDVNGDGRLDIVSPKGWLQAPQDVLRQRWHWRPEFRLHRDCGLPILVTDVDSDGDSDLIWGRGHNIGLYWLEQRTNDGSDRQWVQHTIDTEISQAHSLLLADMDADGREDLIAGKRYLGHGGKDPGEYDPLPIYWYGFDKDRRAWRRHTISAPDEVGFDLDPTVADVDGDGDQDIVAPSRNGLYWFKNQSPAGKSPAGLEAAARELVAPYEDHSHLLVVRDQSGQLSPVENRFQWRRRRQHILDGMQHAMGPLPTPIHRSPLQVEVVERTAAEHYDRLTIRYQPEQGDRTPAYLLIPHGLKQPAPAMLCLHQTTNIGKGEPAGLGGRESLHYAHELAQRGFVCLAPDYPSFGDYEFDFSAPGATTSGSMKAIWNNIRAIDLLESRSEVDPDRIGVIGHSLGGHNALFTAAFDQRLRAVVTSCGFTAFHHYYEGNLRGWTSDRYMPRIRQRYHDNPDEAPFDFYEVIAAIAPRPVFVNAPQHDSNFDLAGVKKVVAESSKVYRFTGAPDALRAEYPDNGHDFPDAIRRQAYRWLERQLGQ